MQVTLKLFNFLFIFFPICYSGIIFAQENFDRESTCQDVYEGFEFCNLSLISSKTQCIENILIKKYSDHLFSSLNNAIREKFNPDQYCKIINDLIVDYLAGVDKKFTKTVFSGQELPEEFKDGKLVKDQCFQIGYYLSTSYDYSVARIFAQNLNPSFILQFDSKSGVLIEDYAIKKDEHEVLFRPGIILQYKKSDEKYLYIPPYSPSRNGDSPYPRGQYPREIQYLKFEEVLPSQAEKICHTKMKNIPVIYLSDMPH